MIKRTRSKNKGKIKQSDLSFWLVQNQKKFMNCRFCKIDHKRSKIIREGKNVFVILSNPRLVDGHLLVIPKKHVEKLSQLNKEERDELIDTIIEFQEIILANFSSGCDIRQNCRPFLKESEVKVDHLHIHLLPREFEDELYKKCQIHEKEVFRMLTEEEVKKFNQIFRK